MTDKPKCECLLMPRVENLERHMFGHRESNTHGVHQAMFGDGEDKPGIIGMMREVRWYLRIVIAGIGIVLAVIIGKWAEMKTSPSQTTSQATPADPPAASTAAKLKPADQN